MTFKQALMLADKGDIIEFSNGLKIIMNDKADLENKRIDMSILDTTKAPSFPALMPELFDDEVQLSSSTLTTNVDLSQYQ